MLGAETAQNQVLDLDYQFVKRLWSLIMEA